MPTIMNILIYLFLSLHVLICNTEEPDKWNKNDKLRKHLLKDYHKLDLPDNRNDNGTTTVTVHMIVKGLTIDEDEQMLSINTLMIMIWNDDRLTFDYKTYGKKQVLFGDDDIWKPDIHVYNNARLSEFDHYKNTHLIVHNNGDVIWVPPAVLEVECYLDLKHWPFDVQSCYVILGSWTSHGWQINLELAHNISQVDTGEHDFFGSNNWKIQKATQERVVTIYECCPEPYIHLEYFFVLRRNSPAFSTVVTVPAVMIPLLLLIQFVLPVDHPKRITIGCVCTILVFLELLFLKVSLPKLGTSVPLIVQYFSQSFIVCVLTVAVSAILGRLAHPQNPLVSYPPPELLKRIMTGIPATILCLRYHADKVGMSGNKEEDGEVLDSTTSTPCYAHEWLFFAKAIDRICIIIFLGIYLFSIIGYVASI